MDKKITLVSKMLNGFVNSTEILHNNTLILDERLKRIERLVKNIITKEENSIYSTYVLGMFNMFLTNFRTINIILSEIETALAFSKVSVLHRAIVNSTELLYMLQSIAKTENLLYDVNEINLVKFEDCLTVKAFIKQNQITFIIEIPLIENSTYSYFKLYSLPIINTDLNETVIVVPKYPYLLVKDSDYLPVVRACNQIAIEDKFLCTNDDVLTHLEPLCEEQLMKFHSNTSACEQHIVDIEDLKVQRIGRVSWILYTKNNVIASKKCHGDVMSHESLQGTYIVTLEDACKVNIGHIHLQNYQFSYTHLNYPITPIIILPALKPEKRTPSVSAVNMKGINLDELKELAQVVKMSKVKYSENYSAVNTKNISLGTIILYVILPLGFITFLVFRYKIKLLNCKRNHQNLNNPDNFALEEGGVMQPEPQRVITVRA